MIGHIILDLDGPVLDGKYRHYQCYKDILDSHGYKPVSIDVYWDMKRKRNPRSELLAISGAESIYNIFLEEWLEKIEKSECLLLDKLQCGALEQLQRWRDCGLKMTLATMRNNYITLTQQLDDIGLISYFDDIAVCSHATGGLAKAKQVLIDVRGLKPASCLWVGDTEVDFEAAKTLGCPVWLLSCGVRSESYLRSLQPEFVSNKLNDVDLRRL